MYKRQIIGKSPHVILGQDMLKPRDGSGKDEGELTGGKRLIERLKKRHGHFADVIVADALYLNAPFINTLKENGLEGVIRLKDERRMIFQDAERLFKQDEGKKASFWKGKKKIEVWDLSGFKKMCIRDRICSKLSFAPVTVVSMPENTEFISPNVSSSLVRISDTLFNI